MPIYDYRCKECETRFEKSVPMKDFKQQQECPACGAASERTVGAYAPAIGDPIRLGIKKPDQGFRDLLRRIDQKTPGSTLKNNSSYI